MIVSFQHKGLERFYREGSKKGIRAEHVKQLRHILTVLDDATTPGDLAIPSFRTHPLKGELDGHYSLRVSGNWRVTCRFTTSRDIELVDYQDYHEENSDHEHEEPGTPRRDSPRRSPRRTWA